MFPLVRSSGQLLPRFSSQLRAKGVPVLQAPCIEQRLWCLDAPVEPEEEELRLREGGLLMLLECVHAGYTQISPLSTEQASVSLSLLARLHAACWQDRELLQKASERLHSTGGYWTLQRRGAEELRHLKPNWQSYLEAFKDKAPELLSRPKIKCLAERLEAVAFWVAAQLTPSPSDAFATLIHGDAKAMNMFLPLEQGEALAIDFQWTGVGYGLSDVAMHLPHSIDVGALRGGGEEKLVRWYHQELLKLLGPESITFPEAWHLYRLAFVDYARMVLSIFLKDASPSNFEAKAENPNVGFVYRNVEASLHYVGMVDHHLSYVEQLPRDRSRSPKRR